MGSTRPSDVRALILREHAAIAVSLADLAAAVNPPAQVSTTHTMHLCRKLYKQLSGHLDLEDEVLVPVLRDSDAWGDVRADTLLRHHQAQRQELKFLAGTDAPEAPELADRLTQLIDELRKDMAHEERHLLSADLLRDDVLAINLEDG
jgi:iron-sulfur cluster repair protein YtfE (RIC family)